MSEEKTQICPVCNVKILKCLGGDRVFYSFGSSSSRKQLWLKICRHVETPGCINKNPGTGA